MFSLGLRQFPQQIALNTLNNSTAEKIYPHVYIPQYIGTRLSSVINNPTETCKGVLIFEHMSQKFYTRNIQGCLHTKTITY